jgi:hypothetical protein
VNTETVRGFALTVFKETTASLFRRLVSRFRVFAENDSRFFLKVVDAQITFVKNESGAVPGLVLRRIAGTNRCRKSSACKPAASVRVRDRSLQDVTLNQVAYHEPEGRTKCL